MGLGSAPIVIPVHWVLCRKKDAAANIVKYKAKPVAQGNYQEYGVDYAPVANQQALWVLLTLAMYFDYELYHLDVDNAFLNGKVDKKIILY